MAMGTCRMPLCKLRGRGLNGFKPIVCRPFGNEQAVDDGRWAVRSIAIRKIWQSC